MNHKNSVIKLLGAAFMMGVIATSCYNYDEVPLVKLAALESEITMEAAGGTFELDFYVNSSYHIEYLSDVDWLILTASEPVDEMATLMGDCAPNDGFKRRVDFVLCSDLDSRRDTVVVRQKAAADAFLEFDEASIILPGAGGATTSTIHTNVNYDEMTVEIIYSDVDNVDWITSLEIIDSDSDDREMHIVVDPNLDEVAPRTASVSLSFTDGWGDNVGVGFTLLQRNANEEAGRPITFEEYRSDYSEGTIYDYVQISGYVVSNKENGNAGEPEQTTTSSINFTPAVTTFYLESEDGKYGLNVQTATEDDNIFEQFDYVTLLIYGATGEIIESDPTAPVLYHLTGVERTMLLSRTAGTKDDIPVKERTIGTLTDDDIYTYVKLTDVELPIRRGPLMPVDGAHNEAGSGQRITKYPLLMRDKNGDSMYLLTNDKCLYYRDGSRLPYGSGNLYGVVVHEHFSRYEWRNGADPSDIYDDETLANIGRYSLRHQTKDDIWGEMEDDFENGFSGLICEYRWRVIRDGIDVPSYGKNGWLTHTYQTKYTGTSSKNYSSGTSNTSFFTVTSTDYLGPCGRSASTLYGINYGNKNGLGIIVDPTHEDWETFRSNRFAYNREGKLEFACEYAENEYCGYGTVGWTEDGTGKQRAPNDYDSTGNIGKGWVNASAHVSYGSHYWWDDDYDRPYGLLLYFSTAEITSDVVSLQFNVRTNGDAVHCPRFWCVEWGTTDDLWTESKWTRVAEFTVPDPPVWSAPTLFQLPGFKQVNVPLPTDILGRDDVYIRINPINDLCGSGADYADAQLKDSESGKAEAQEHAVYFGYIAVRYNK